MGSQNGVKGALRRDERNTTYNLDPYSQIHWQFAENWNFDGGLRYSTVKFKSKDRYWQNGNDSGSKRFSKALPSLGISWQGLPESNIYFAYSKGFETGTFLEMAYRPDGQPGLNFNLQPLSSDNYEVGVKTILGDGLLTTALFRTDTQNDIVSATTINGRATYRNAGKTRRQGAELGWSGNLWEDLKLNVAYTYIDARFRETVGTTIQQGNRIAGIAKHLGYASLGWHDKQNWRVGADWRYHGKVQVNNANSEQASSYSTVGLYAGYLWEKGHWSIDSHARVDNLFDKDYANVVINDANSRYYEPALKRNYIIGTNIKYLF